MNDKDSPRGPADDTTEDDTIEPRTVGRREPVFSAFDDEDYEESERDTDYTTAYEAELEDEDYPEPGDDGDPDQAETEWQVLGSGNDSPVDRFRARNPWDRTDDGGEYDAGEDQEEEGIDPDADSYDDSEDPYDDDDGPDEDWDEQEEQGDDPVAYHTEPEDKGHGWPLGLIIVGVTALVLLAAGGYGVVQQRAATQAEIRQLQARLATAASPEEVAASKEVVRDLEARNIKYQETIDSLTMENRRLTDMVTGLEKQLVAQQAALSGSATAKKAPAKPATAKPAAASKPASTKTATRSAAASSGGDWFVNFSSYTERSIADNWARKLKPSAGKAIVSAGEKDGKTFYRVRVVGLASRAQAEQVANQLQAAYDLPRLWVGTE